jgi:hypothetical protein
MLLIGCGADDRRPDPGFDVNEHVLLTPIRIGSSLHLSRGCRREPV